jgi:putative ATPase
MFDPPATDPADLRPLADRMRPRHAAELVGQSHLLKPGLPLRRALDGALLYSMVLWGPPGTGKTTLARLLAAQSGAHWQSLSAVLGGVQELRAAVAEARQRRAAGRRSVLFVDEIHRWNKAQQDALLPHLEDGTLTLIGATTENPSFELNAALLSRCRVHVLKPLAATEIAEALQRALTDAERGLGALGLSADPEWLAQLASAADGDLRRALGLLESAAELAGPGGALAEVSLTTLLGNAARRFDKQGEAWYDQISALHKCVRGSNPDAALYWLCRMLDGGCDPGFLARRLTRMASEDIGNADPRALPLALSAWDAYERLGSPEGELALAQLTIYLAVAAKSNASYRAFKAARALVETHGSLEVPLHLRNAPTRLMKDLGYAQGYRYDHDEADGVALSQTGFPAEIGEQTLYQPVDRGLEAKIRERLDWIRQRRADASR